MIAIIDYGMGNLRSVQRAFQKVGAEVVITDERETIKSARAVVLPGVGAFGDAMTNLRSQGLVETIERVVERGKPLFGICLGLQLFFEESEEMGLHRGLGFFPGQVRRFDVGLKVPHIGWNQVHIRRQGPLLAGLADGSYAYFAHSYYVEPTEDDIILATTDYGLDFASIVGQGNVFGIQFHPEKSQDVGLRILSNFVAMVEKGREQ
ncbi:MAG TPA: imidazole glycerol phosphate synthase subunit HisH [Anaerolineae bacterium]|nr:imidazole glycerol phosphate synthase subunit HisH [Anaerolineae bacterium]